MLCFLNKLDIVEKKDSSCVTGIIIHIRCSFIRVYSSLLRATTSWIEPSYQAGQVEIRDAVTN